MKILEKGTKQYFLDKFAKSKHLDTIKELKDDKLVLWIGSEDDYRTLKQNRAVHALIGELYKSGLTSFNSYNECRDYFKEQAGLITKEQKEVHPIVKNLQRKLYSMLTNEEIKKLYSESILESKIIVRSVADASKEELTLMIKCVIEYCYEVDLNSNKFQEIMKGLENE